MATYAFDTLLQAENLQKNGFDEMQAKGLVEVIALSTSNLATKQDINQVKLEMRIEMQQLDNKILKMTISLGVVNIAALGGYTYLLQWIN
jgi:hypothetical protein